MSLYGNSLSRKILIGLLPFCYALRDNFNASRVIFFFNGLTRVILQNVFRCNWNEFLLALRHKSKDFFHQFTNIVSGFSFMKPGGHGKFIQSISKRARRQILVGQLKSHLFLRKLNQILKCYIPCRWHSYHGNTTTIFDAGQIVLLKGTEFPVVYLELQSDETTLGTNQKIRGPRYGRLLDFSEPSILKGRQILNDLGFKPCLALHNGAL